MFAGCGSNIAVVAGESSPTRTALIPLTPVTRYPTGVIKVPVKVTRPLVASTA